MAIRDSHLLEKCYPFEMKTDITYEEVLAKARPGLRYRIEESVSLIRKAERLAKMYDPQDGYFLAFSGGKDSQALYHVAELAGVLFKAHFAPTTVEPPQLIRFIRKNYPEVEFGKVDMSMYQAAVKMNMLPTMKIRWCCAKYKETTGAGKVTMTGVRHAESTKEEREIVWRSQITNFRGIWTALMNGAKRGGRRF